jgi:hypothetical protein
MPYSELNRQLIVSFYSIADPLASIHYPDIYAFAFTFSFFAFLAFFTLVESAQD